MAPPIRILIINPNTTDSMTDALKPLVTALVYPNVSYSFFTGPSPGIASINSPADAAESASLCLPHLLPLLRDHDAFLVACYSAHPLVHALRDACVKAGLRGRYVAGIFEASVVTALALVGRDERFGIVSTGKIWEGALTDAVGELLGGRERFAGCTTTGLSAAELHDRPAGEVQTRMREATETLLRSQGKPVQVVCLGCAGMVGLEAVVRRACMGELREDMGRDVYIVDGVKAGVGVLVGLVRGGFQ